MNLYNALYAQTKIVLKMVIRLTVPASGTNQWHQPVAPAVAPAVEPLLVSIENDIKILSFPENQSQATLSPTQTSNACAIISLLVCSEVYGNQVPELSVQNIREIQDFCILKMRQGNDLYEMNQHHIPQPNLHVQ